MRHLIMTVVLLSSFLASAQTTKKPTTKPAAKPAAAAPPKDTKAKFPGGTDALQVYFDETKDISLRYSRAFTGDTCKLKLSISAAGKVTKAVVTKATHDCPTCDSAYVDRALAMPAWKPATSKGKAVASTHNYTIVIHPYTMEADVPNEDYSETIASDEVLEAPHGEQHDKPLEFCDESAEFPGGNPALQLFLASNLKYPPSAIEDNVSGRVYLKFVVRKDGSITDITLMRGLPGCPDCDQEAIRVVKAMPKWRPGKDNGYPVDSYFTMPIKFQIAR